MISYFGITDIGRRRALNEDAILAREDVFVLCDGMGGHKAGEVASQLAVDAIDAFVKRSSADAEITWPYGFQPSLSLEGNRLYTAVKLANRAVFRKAASSDDYTGMGTTVTVMTVTPNRPYMTFTHVGDSRIYLVRAGAITQLTKDDSWANLAWSGSAEDTASASMKNVLTKALGAREDVEFEVKGQELRPGDTVLMCSDGLTNMLPDPRILEIVLPRGADVEGACRELVEAANAAGGRDNVSAILVHYTP